MQEAAAQASDQREWVRTGECSGL